MDRREAARIRAGHSRYAIEDYMQVRHIMTKLGGAAPMRVTPVRGKERQW
jgi:hypothetical protein